MAESQDEFINFGGLEDFFKGYVNDHSYCVR